MKKKIAEAKETMPAQMKLPNIKMFKNESTYQKELENFLVSFRRPPERIIIPKKTRPVGEVKTDAKKSEQPKVDDTEVKR